MDFKQDKAQENHTMKNIQKVSDALLCCNCGACNAICPKDAITFSVSSMGRMYASVNNDLCINCSLCEKVCPSLHTTPQPDGKAVTDSYVGNIISLHTGRATDERIFANAQSGGCCTALLTYLFDEKKIDCAIVCRMSYGTTPQVESVIVKSAKELLDTQKSCYTPIDMLSALKLTQKEQNVAFVGLPCHIQGLNHLQAVSHRFDHIKYKLGLICDRTLCASIQDVFVSLYSSGYCTGIPLKIDWRRKAFVHKQKFYPYKTAPVVIYTPDGTNEYVVRNAYRFLLKDMFTPPRCRVCGDKLNTGADIVFGDPWRMERIDWDKGENVIIVRTDMGQVLCRDATDKGYLKLSERNPHEIIKGQLIPERKNSVNIYAQAYRTLFHHQTVFPLLQPEKEGYKSAKHLAVRKAQKEIRTFLLQEKKSKEEVISTALKAIKLFDRSEKSRLFSLLCRVKKKITSLI